MEYPKYNQVILELENLDQIILKPQNIKRLFFENIHKNIILNDDRLIEYYEGEDFVLILDSKCLTKHYLNCVSEESEDTIGKRLKCKDIASVTIYTDKEKMSINPIWDHNNEYTNNYMTLYKNNKDNCLIIRCNKEKTAEEFYNSFWK